MLKSLKLIYLLITLYSCNQKQNIKYYWFDFHGHNYEKCDTIPIIKFENSQKGDTLLFSYSTKFGTQNYFLIPNKDSSFIISSPRDTLIHRNDSLSYIRSFLDTTVFINKTASKIKKYILDEFVMDGASIHYYESTLGIYAIHSDTWPGIRYLQTNDTALNRKISLLIKATVPSFFIRGDFENSLK